jgi:hypothetical protein
MKMKLKSMLVAILLLTGVTMSPAIADETFQLPLIESFTVSQDDIELASTNRSLTFTLVVSHNIGIASINPLLKFQSVDQNFQIETKMNRTDSPVNFSAKKVTFNAQIQIPASFRQGLYEFYAEPIEGLPINNKAISPITGIIRPANFTNFPNAENLVRLRLNGNLNLDFKTFVGPSYDTSLGINDSTPIKLPTALPIWRVGEQYIAAKYFEKRTPLADLSISSSTNLVCYSDGKTLTFKSEGICDFSVFTPQTNNYLEKRVNFSVRIIPKREAQILSISTVPEQTVENLPKIVLLATVYTSTFDAVIPTSLTPDVCLASIASVRLISGGTCEIGYQVGENQNQLQSQLYKLTFKIVKKSQSINFSPTTSVDLTTKSVLLTATSSSGGVISFSATPQGICSVAGATLTLLKPGSCLVTATQSGTGTISAISASVTITITGSVASSSKTITCVKGTKISKKTGVSPKCPKGYKVKK